MPVFYFDMKQNHLALQTFQLIRFQLDFNFKLYAVNDYYSYLLTDWKFASKPLLQIFLMTVG
jgi:hypothetical protein